MATVTVDLPAHNVASTVVAVPDPECLADPAATTGITITHPSDIFYVGSADGTSGGTALGFGLFDLPAGASLLDVRFVGHTQRLDASFDVPPDSWDAAVVSPVPTVGPSLAVAYDVRTGLQLGYTLTPDGTLAEIVGTPIAHLMAEGDYVIAGIGTPDTGTFGLCPRVVIADSNWWEFPAFDSPILLTYLALRITYTTGGDAPPCQLYPRDDHQGAGSGAIWPPPSSQQAGVPGRYY